MAASFILNSIVVTFAVVIHFEFLTRLTAFAPIIHVRHRYRVVLGVIVALIAHSVEIWIFAFAYYFMHKSDGWGSLEGSFNGSLMDCAYFSFTTFTTLGFGDIQPIGDLKFLTGLEALTGLVLITWTASFLFIEMQRSWNGS